MIWSKRRAHQAPRRPRFSTYRKKAVMSGLRKVMEKNEYPATCAALPLPRRMPADKIAWASGKLTTATKIMMSDDISIDAGSLE